MFEQLLGSKTRFKLMQLFIHHPETFYYVRQLTRILNTQINSVRRELMNLERIGLVKSYNEIPHSPGGILEEKEIYGHDEGNTRSTAASQRKYFRLNPDFVIYPELKALFLKEQIMTEKDLVKSIRKVGKINYLVLTGVFVGLEKDIPTDMFIVGKVDSERLAKLISEYEKAFNKDINYTIFSYKEYMYRLNINDKFVHNILESKKIVAIDELGDESEPKAELGGLSGVHFEASEHYAQ